MNKTEEGNKIIDEFLDSANRQPAWRGNVLQYHEVWDCLMPVVDKIEEMLADGDELLIGYRETTIDVHCPSWLFGQPEDRDIDTLSFTGKGETKIEATFNCVSAILFRECFWSMGYLHAASFPPSL